MKKYDFLLWVYVFFSKLFLLKNKDISFFMVINSIYLTNVFCIEFESKNTA